MKIELSPRKNALFSFAIVILFVLGFYLNQDNLIVFFTETLSALAKIILMALGLISYGLFGAYAKAREAGYSGQYNKRAALFWKPLVLDFSFGSLFSLISQVIQLLIFSSFSYLFGSAYISTYYALIIGNYDPSRHLPPGMTFLPMLVLVIVAIGYLLRLLDSKKRTNQHESNNKKNS